MTDIPESTSAARGSAGEVFAAFARLGLTSFGGPVAHLGYFRTEFVERRKWLSDSAYADLVALCQFLPGPASSQVGFAIGLLRAGGWGALAAFAAFTLPSVALMVAFAFGAAAISGPVGAGLLMGLKIVAVAIVAQAVMGMAKSLAPDAVRASIAAGAAIITLLFAQAGGQVLAIALGGLAGLLWSHASGPATSGLQLRSPRRLGWMSLSLSALLLVGAPLANAALGGPGSSGLVGLFDAFYRSGALVFGGGHVVLPLLQAEVLAPGWVSEEEFLAGYGAAQAMPGPLFTFAPYLGVLAGEAALGSAWGGAAPWVGALVALVGIFLPGFLLLLGVLPLWGRLASLRWAGSFMRGANAAVVGVLAAALFDPVFTTAVTGAGSFSLALACFVLLVAWKAPPLAVVLVGSAGGILLQPLGL